MPPTVHIQFSDRLVSYETFMTDLTARLARVIKSDAADPEYISQRTAYSIFGRKNVDRWRRTGKVKPSKRPGKVNTAWQTYASFREQNRITSTNKTDTMDYAIYKTNDGKNPRVIYRFTQEACNHRAKLAAKAKLNEMWLRVTDRLDYFQNAEGNDNEFSYDHPTSINTSERIRFYIAKL